MAIEIFYYTKAKSKRDLPDALFVDTGKSNLTGPYEIEELKEELEEGWYYQDSEIDESPHGPFLTEAAAYLLAPIAAKGDA